MYKGKYEQNQTPAAPKAAKVSAPQAQSAPSETPTLPRNKRKKRTTKGTYIFYGIYLSVILVFFIVIGIAMGALNNWLVDFQAAQPDTASQRIFSELFADPDWAEIYALANPNDSSADSKSACAAYMEEQIGDKKLAYIETASDPSGDRKYIVYYQSDAENGIGIATFTLTADNKDAQIPNWKLGTVEVFFSRYLRFDIIALPGYTVTVNGTALDESHIIRTVSTRAEEYLPEGIHGYQLLTYRVTDLKAAPEVVVTGKDGQTVEIIYDEASGTYTQVMAEAPTISDSEYTTLLTAAQTYCRYMIGDVGKTGLGKCFDSSTEIYKTITSSTTWMQNFKGFQFSKETITDFYCYSDSLYSAKVSLTLDVTRKNGTIKSYELSSTFFLEKQGDQWKVIEMTNVNVQEQVTMVRLTYKDADGNVLSSDFVDANSKNLATPTVTAPQGQIFSGWFEETTDTQGNTTLTLQFQPDANGNVSVGEALEPMVLVPRFEEVQ